MKKHGKNNNLVNILVLVLLGWIICNFSFEPYVRNNLHKAGALFSDIGKLFEFIWRAKGKDKSKLVTITAENSQKLVLDFKQDSDFTRVSDQQYFLHLLNTDKVTLINQLKNRIKSLKLPIMVFHGKDGKYVVTSGPYKNLKMARAAKHRLLEQKISSTLVSKRLTTQ